MEQGGFFLLRSSAPTFSRVGPLRDPDADDPHGSLAVGVVGGGEFFSMDEGFKFGFIERFRYTFGDVATMAPSGRELPQSG